MGYFVLGLAGAGALATGFIYNLNRTHWGHPSEKEGLFIEEIRRKPSEKSFSSRFVRLLPSGGAFMGFLARLASRSHAGMFTRLPHGFAVAFCLSGTPSTMDNFESCFIPLVQMGAPKARPCCDRPAFLLAST